MLLLLCVGIPLGGSAAPVDSATAIVEIRQDVVMRGDVQEIIDKLQELINELNKAKDEVESDITRPGDNADDVRLTSINIRLFNYLNNASHKISDILNPQIAPTLDPVDAGSVENVVTPTSLLQYANTTLGLANEALAAATTLNQPLRDEVIGSKVKTVQYLMPGYYAAAGL